MTAPDFITVAALQWAYEHLEFWIAVAGLAWGGFRWYSWITDKVTTIDNGVASAATDNKAGFNSVVAEVRSQTESTVRELQELRNDFRTFYTQPDPIMMPVHARSTRKAKSVTERTKAKTKAPARTKTATKAETRASVKSAK